MVLPKVIMHSAISLDGGIEGFDEEVVGVYYELAGRFGCDACLCGSETLLTAPLAEDDPVDEREERLPDPPAEGSLLVVPDSKGRIRNWHACITGSYSRAAVALVASTTPGEYLDLLMKRGVPYIQTPGEQVDYRTALEELGQRFAVRSLRTDSGGVLNSILLQQGLVDEISIVLTPDLVGTDTRNLFRTLHLPAAMKLRLLSCEAIREKYVWLRYAAGGPSSGAR